MKLIKKIVFVCLLDLMPLSGFTITNIIRVGIFDEYESESSKHELGLQKELFASLMINHGKQAVFINAPRSKIMSMVKKGKIDVLPFIEYDEALEEYLDFSDETIVSSWDVLLVDKSVNYKKPEDIEGLRIGLIAEMPSSYDFAKYIDSLDLNFFPVYSRNLDELYRAVENKEIDAIVIPSFAESGFFDGRIGLVRSGFFFNTSSMKVATLDGDPDGLMPSINKNLISLKSRKSSDIDKLFEKHKRIKKHWLESSLLRERIDIIIIILFVFVGTILGLFFIFKKPKQNTSLSRSVLAKMTTVAVIFLVVTLSIEAVGLYRVYVNDKKKLKNDVFNYSKERLKLESKWLRLLIDNIRYSLRNEPLELQKEHVAKMLEHILNSSDFHFFITDYDGVKMTGKSAGQNISDATDKDGMKVVQEQIAIAKSGGGFLIYHMAPEFDHGDRDYEKLGYFYGMDEFRWVVGVGMDIGNNESVLASHRRYLDRMILNQFLLIAVVMVLLFLVVVMIGYRFASLLKKNRQRIDKYLEEARQKDITINENDFYYKEFRYIVLVFNEMLINQQRSKRALQEQEENLRITFASIGDAVITVDTGSVVTRMNQVACKLTGWGMEEGVGRKLNDIFKVVNFNTRAAIKSPVDRVLKTGEISGLEKHTALISRGSKEYLIDDSAAPIKDLNGVIVGVILVFRDVTDEYKMERKIHDQQKDESIGLLAGGSGS
jgi:PAS domain S-box-containing protein